jgi:hypothetical protein
LTAHNQILKQQKQLNGRNHHIPININTEYQWTQFPHQETPFGKLDEKGRSNKISQDTHLIDRNKHWLRVKGWKIYQANRPRKQAE